MPTRRIRRDRLFVKAGSAYDEELNGITAALSCPARQPWGGWWAGPAGSRRAEYTRKGSDPLICDNPGFGEVTAPRGTVRPCGDANGSHIGATPRHRHKPCDSSVRQGGAVLLSRRGRRLGLRAVFLGLHPRHSLPVGGTGPEFTEAGSSRHLIHRARCRQ